MEQKPTKPTFNLKKTVANLQALKTAKTQEKPKSDCKDCDSKKQIWHNSLAANKDYKAPAPPR